MNAMSTPLEKIRFSYKIWLESDGRFVLGRGGVRILKAIEEKRSISKAAGKLGMSYRYVWSYIERINRALGKPIIETFRGGRRGGGGATLTELGRDLLRRYMHMDEHVNRLLRAGCSGVRGIENRFEGIIRGLEMKNGYAEVKIEFETPNVITALISEAKLEELDAQIGDKVEVTVRSSDIHISKGN